MLKVAVGPCQSVRGWLQTSCVLPPPELEVGRDWVGGACCVEPAPRGVEPVGAPAATKVEPGVLDVGRGGGVLEGRSVGLWVSVGGMGVEVGSAACVSTTMVSAAASAVCPISTGLTVGVP